MVVPRSFNPHTHAGCDQCGIYIPSPDEVSIHTPTQGVTFQCRIYSLLQLVSIHTPTQGVTRKIPAKHHSCPGFNPHTHAGCDFKATIVDTQIDVSIHTPTQGVTGVISWTDKTFEVSIHTPTQGVTYKKH